MLSRKQLWRRTPVSKPFSPTQKTPYNSFHEIDTGSLSDVTDIESNSTSQGSFKNVPSLRSCISSADLRKLDPVIKQKRSRKIRFSSYVKVCLIPTRDELLHLHDDLYWNLQDCDAFKKDAVEQLKRFSKHRCIAMKEAIRLLFQPTKSGEEDYTEDLLRDCVYLDEVVSNSNADHHVSSPSDVVPPLTELPNDSVHGAAVRSRETSPTKSSITKHSHMTDPRSACSLDEEVHGGGGYDDLAATSSSDGDDEDLSDSEGSGDDCPFRTGKTDIDLHLHEGGRAPHVTHPSSRQQIAWEVTWTKDNSASTVRVL